MPSTLASVSLQRISATVTFLLCSETDISVWLQQAARESGNLYQCPAITTHIVRSGLGPDIHVFLCRGITKTWMPGLRPA